MSHAEKCPICYGKGKVQETSGFGTSQKKADRTCHGCGGKGWVEVADTLFQSDILGKSHLVK